MTKITFKQIDYAYKEKKVLNHIDLTINNGEFFSLLGPSGVGKSTLINLLAGFLYPQKGKILIDSEDVTFLPPNKRRLGLVFQNYALFPNMTVAGNVAYGLKINKLKKNDIEVKVKEVLGLVKLKDFMDRMPRELSGGQQQRVAIARALVVKPRVLLLDEPLSNLDAKLRKDMRMMIRELQQRVGITTIMVTHDQSEALSISDRIGILGNGRLQQVGTPREVYNYPTNSYVADFIGSTNFIKAKTVNNKMILNLIDVKGKRLQLSPHIFVESLKKNTVLMIRPENIHILTQPTINTLVGKIKKIEYLGNAVRGRIEFKRGNLNFYQLINYTLPALSIGDNVNVLLDQNTIVTINTGKKEV